MEKTSDYAMAEKIASHERALKSLVRFHVKLKRFAQHLPLRGVFVHKFSIIARVGEENEIHYN